MAAPELSVRVLFVSSHAKAGGAERYLVNLVESLGEGWTSCVVCLEDGPLVGQLRELGATTEILPTSARAAGMLAAARRLRRLLARERPAVVHANGVKAAIVTVLATLGTRRPAVWVKHDFSFDGPLARLVATRCRRVVGVSEAVTETFGSRTRRRKVRVVYNGLPPTTVDRDAGRRLLADALGEQASEAVALVGRLDPVKGHRELLAAALELRGERPGLRFVFIGGPSPVHPGYEDRLRDEVRDQGLAETVVFLGQLEDPVALMAGCDLVAIPTIVDEHGFGREGFPFVGLEAMAAGAPIVGYDHGGLPELVGSCGLLVGPGDRLALARAIATLLDDDALREQLAECGRQRVAREFSLERTVEAMRAVYRDAAAS